jgi:AraC-like DNA-binding protein
MQDTHLIQDLKHAFSKRVKDGFIDLDRFLTNHQSFNILRLEDLHEQTRGVVPPFRQSDFLMIFVKQGAGERSIGHYSFTIQNNSLAVVPKHVIHAAAYSSKPYGYLVSFNPDFFLDQAFSYKLLNSRRLLKPSLKPVWVLSQQQAAGISNIFEAIIEESNSGFSEKREMIALKLLELLILCDRLFNEQDIYESTAGYSSTVEAFNELIESNFTTHRDVLFYATALHTHPNNLNSVIKKATGLTAKQTITSRVLIEAKYLLASGTLTVKEIAYELGFDDPNYFNSFFKKELHVTPAQFRNQLI